MDPRLRDRDSGGSGPYPEVYAGRENADAPSYRNTEIALPECAGPCSRRPFASTKSPNEQGCKKTSQSTVPLESNHPTVCSSPGTG